MARTWTCPSCGSANSVDETSCSSCGRWASVFDLERTEDSGNGAHAGEPYATVETWAPPETPEPEHTQSHLPPVVVAERRPPDVAREDETVFGDRPVGEPEEQERGAGIGRWIWIAVIAGWILFGQLLDAFR